MVRTGLTVPVELTTVSTRPRDAWAVRYFGMALRPPRHQRDGAGGHKAHQHAHDQQSYQPPSHKSPSSIAAKTRTPQAAPAIELDWLVTIVTHRGPRRVVEWQTARRKSGGRMVDNAISYVNDVSKVKEFLAETAAFHQPATAADWRKRGDHCPGRQRFAAAAAVLSAMSKGSAGSIDGLGDGGEGDFFAAVGALSLPAHLSGVEAQAPPTSGTAEVIDRLVVGPPPPLPAHEQVGASCDGSHGDGGDQRDSRVQGASPSQRKRRRLLAVANLGTHPALFPTHFASSFFLPHPFPDLSCARREPARRPSPWDDSSAGLTAPWRECVGYGKGAGNSSGNGDPSRPRADPLVLSFPRSAWERPSGRSASRKDRCGRRTSAPTTQSVADWRSHAERGNEG